MTQRARGKDSFYDTFWRFFASVRLAIVLIFLIAVAAVLGSLIQQEGAYPSSLPPEIYYPLEYGTYGEIMYALGFTRMYSSWWFLLLLLLFGINLIVCSIDRFVPLIRTLRNPKISRSQRFISSRPFNARLETDRGADDALDIVTRAFKRERYEVRREGLTAYADKGRWGRYGPYVTHIGLLFLLVATLGMALPGWFHDEFFWVAEGETVKVPHTDFFVRNDGFKIEFYEDGRPKLFRTQAVIVRDGDEVHSHPIEVNDPLVYQRVNLLQASYQFRLGQASFTLMYHGPEGGAPEPLGVLTIDMQNPASQYVVGDGIRITLLNYFPDFAMDPELGPITQSPDPLNPAFVLQVEEEGRPATPMILFVLQPDLVLPGLESPYTFSLSDIEIVAMSGLVSHKNLALPYIYTGLLITVFGVFLSFYLYHRRVWIRCEDGLILIGASSNKHPLSLQREMQRIVGSIRSELEADETPLAGRAARPTASAASDL